MWFTSLLTLKEIYLEQKQDKSADLPQQNDSVSSWENEENILMQRRK